jgi:pimeloyl-ACP methyl ester carboxylesterase
MSVSPRLRSLVLLLALSGCAPSDPPVAPAQATARENRVRSLAGDGTSIRYRVYGRGEPAIVFTHGWSCDSGYWDAQLDHFAANHAVITLDLAGHGESPGRQGTDWSIAAFGADVAAVIADSGARRVVLVGSSMGGPVALEAARRLPGQVVGIVGVDTFREIATPLPKELWDGLVEQMRVDFVGATAVFVGKDFFTGRTDPVLKRWIVEDMAAAPPEVAIPAVLALAAYDAGPALAALDLPVLAVNASGSPTDEAATKRIEPRFRLVELQGVGHFPMLEDPSTFNRVLERILAEWIAREPQRNPLSAAPGNR